MKKDLLKIFAILIGVVFLLEAVAIPLISHHRTANKDDSGDMKGGYITVNINATLSSYSSYITVEGPLSEIKDKKDEWREKGFITSETHVTGNSTIFNLIDDSVVLDISQYLLNHGFNVRSEATFELPDKIGNITAGNVVKLKTTPIYRIGSTVPLSIVGYVENGELVTILKAEMLPTRKTFLANATVTEVLSVKKNGSSANVSCSDVGPGDSVKERLRVIIRRNPAQGFFVDTPIELVTATNGTCFDKGDDLTLNIDAVLSDGRIERIVKYSVVEETEGVTEDKGNESYIENVSVNES